MFNFPPQKKFELWKMKKLTIFKMYQFLEETSNLKATLHKLEAVLGKQQNWEDYHSILYLL